MSDLKKKYNEVLQNLKDNIANPRDLKYAQEQVKKLANAFLDEMERMEKLTDSKFVELDKKQLDLERKIASLEKTLNGIEKDIYDIDDNYYDLEVVCPYCNYEFVLEEDTERSEVECPECGNIIEIDWEGDSLEEGCSGHCSSCSTQCGDQNEDDKNTNKNNEDNEDDM